MRRVVVSGIGWISPHGTDIAAGFAALMDGVSAIRLRSVGEAPFQLSIPSAECASADASTLVGKGRAAALDRVSHLALIAAESAWNDAGLADLDPGIRERAVVMVGTGIGGAQTTEKGYRDTFIRQRPRLSPLTVVQCMNNAPAAHVAHRFALGGACYTYSLACASSAAAIAEAARRVRAGECEIAIGGGAEAAFPYGVVKAWQSMQVLASADEATASAACQPFGLGRRGLVLGEGAAMLVLEDREHAIARGAAWHAEWAGSGSSCDHSHLTAPTVDGQARALEAVLRDARASPSDVGYVNAHGTATPEGDPVEVGALRRVFGDDARRLPVSATKSMHGHLMGAAGALEAVITLVAVKTGRIPPTAYVTEIDPACAGVDHVLGSGRETAAIGLALSSSFAFGGSNVILGFRRGDGAR